MSKKRKSKSEMNEKNEKTRNWTADKVTLFTEVPSDIKVNFAECLEKRVLKKSANKDVFNSVLEEFRKRLSKQYFIEININKRHFPVNKYGFLTINIKKIQVKQCRIWLFIYCKTKLKMKKYLCFLQNIHYL